MRKRRRRRTRPFRPLIIIALVAGILHAASAAQRHPVAALLIATSLAALVFWIRHRVRGKRRVRMRTLDQLLAMSPARFEQAIASLFRELGYRRVRTVGRSGDLAVDIECRDAEGRALMIQCKRYAPGLKVGSRDVQTFVGMIFMHHRADRASSLPRPHSPNRLLVSRAIKGSSSSMEGGWPRCSLRGRLLRPWKGEAV